MEGTLKMSEKEIDRYAVLVQVQQKKLKQVEAAKILNITERQVRNLLLSLKIGLSGLISKRRGKKSNNRKPVDMRKEILSLIETKYKGFGPTFASEKLEELDGIKIHPETLRLWMIEAHIWIPKQRRRRIHPPRERRACFGELIQVDGSHHHWFGEDCPRATLLVFIDDATSQLTALHFCKEETVQDYFQVLESHLKKHGRPRGIYSDKLKVFNGEKNLSQFQRALKELEIESILANSPQAKGRVERVNRTLQDRLIKEMLLKEIKTIEDANQYLSEYLKQHNAKFSMEPANKFNAHRPLEKSHNLQRILRRVEERTLSKDYTFCFYNKNYIILDRGDLRNPKGVKVEVRVLEGCKPKVYLRGQEVRFKALSEVPKLQENRNVEWKTQKKRVILKNHPWKEWNCRGTAAGF